MPFLDSLGPTPCSEFRPGEKLSAGSEVEVLLIRLNYDARR